MEDLHWQGGKNYDPIVRHKGGGGWQEHREGKNKAFPFCGPMNGRTFVAGMLIWRENKGRRWQSVFTHGGVKIIEKSPSPLKLQKSLSFSLWRAESMTITEVWVLKGVGRLREVMMKRMTRESRKRKWSINGRNSANINSSVAETYSTYNENTVTILKFRWICIFTYLEYFTISFVHMLRSFLHHLKNHKWETCEFNPKIDRVMNSKRKWIVEQLNFLALVHCWGFFDELHLKKEDFLSQSFFVSISFYFLQPSICGTQFTMREGRKIFLSSVQSTLKRNFITIFLHRVLSL